MNCPSDRIYDFLARLSPLLSPSLDSSDSLSASHPGSHYHSGCHLIGQEKNNEKNKTAQGNRDKSGALKCQRRAVTSAQSARRPHERQRPAPPPISSYAGFQSVTPQILISNGLRMKRGRQFSSSSSSAAGTFYTF